MRAWRSGSKQVLANRPIKESEWPRLTASMVNDGLVCRITADGLHWTHGAYTVQAKVIREVWNLSSHQYNRLRNYIYVSDPWG
jgi:hypothetical protein